MTPLAAAAALAGAGALSASPRYHWWRPRQKGLPILMYHQVSPHRAGSALNAWRVLPEAFDRQLGFLVRRVLGLHRAVIAEACELFGLGLAIERNSLGAEIARQNGRGFKPLFGRADPQLDLSGSARRSSCAGCSRLPRRGRWRS